MNSRYKKGLLFLLLLSGLLAVYSLVDKQALSPTETVTEQRHVEPPAIGSAAEPMADNLHQHTEVRNLPELDPEVAAAVIQMSKHTMEGAEVIQHPEGTIQVNFNGHYQQVVAAAFDESGRLVIAHAEDFLPSESASAQQTETPVKAPEQAEIETSQPAKTNNPLTWQTN